MKYKMTISRRIAAAAAAAICAAGLLGGCGSAGAAGSKEAEEIAAGEDEDMIVVDEGEAGDAELTPDAEEEVMTLENSAPADSSALMADNLIVSTKTDYEHAAQDVITLGEGEGVTVTIAVNCADAEADLLYFDYDPELLNVEVRDAVHENGTSVIEAYVTGLDSCDTELIISTQHEIETMGEEAKGIYLDIWKLDPEQGRLVYTTQSADKYHLSEECAGKKAVATTYYDAFLMGMEPCEKCAAE